MNTPIRTEGAVDRWRVVKVPRVGSRVLKVLYEAPDRGSCVTWIEAGHGYRGDVSARLEIQRAHVVVQWRKDGEL